VDSFVITPICKYDGPSSSCRYFHTNQLKKTKKQFSFRLSSTTENDEDRDFSHVTSSTTIAPTNKKLTTSTSLAILVQCATMMIVQNALAYDTISYDYEVDTTPKDHTFFSLFDPRYLVAGGGCAALSHGIATPLDVIKTKMQANREKFNSGFLNAAISIVQTNGGGGGGIGVLLSGLVPTLLGYGVEGAVKFGMYESFKPVFVDMFNAHDKTIPYLAASVGAGAAASLLLVPMERKGSRQ
jgi:Mitochondrial carrier protein.